MSTELPDPISDVLKDTADEARVSRLWRRIESQKRRARPSPVRMAACGAIAAAAALLLWVAWPRNESVLPSPGPIELAGGGGFTSVEGPTIVALDDGSRIVLDEGTRIEPLRNDGGALTLRLARGRARFEVRPHGPRTWVVESGVASIEVVGTIFTVARAEGWAQVDVERGTVIVRGERVPDRAKRLTRGDSLLVGEQRRAENIAPSSPRAAVEVVAPSRGVEPAQRPRSLRVEEPQAEEQDAEALMSLADAARRAGRADEAAALLERATARSGDPAAGVAAFTLGRLELDSLRRPERAVLAFSRALELTLPPRLREEATARLVDAHARAGDAQAARRAAESYLRDYPDGRHADHVRSTLAP